jgi:hypothetical protein
LGPAPPKEISAEPEGRCSVQVRVVGTGFCDQPSGLFSMGPHDSIDQIQHRLLLAIRSSKHQVMVRLQQLAFEYLALYCIVNTDGPKHASAAECLASSTGKLFWITTLLACA